MGTACCVDNKFTPLGTLVTSADQEEQPDGDVGNSSAITDHKLLKAARDGNVVAIQKMLARGADIETRCPFWVSPENASSGWTSNSVSNRGTGMTPLMCAAQGGYALACKVLIVAGACITAEDEDGMQSLHFAASSGSLETCQVLLEMRADPEAQDDEGRMACDLVPSSEVATGADRKRWRLLFAQVREGAAA
mmetsp:Transcript_45375/g.104868  ORF Transcript_45375/g.104868 Transcript_45375/m.104868 type:complete len:193 (+) Transcript_45375:57-635(+)